MDGVAREYGVFGAVSLCLVPDEIGDLDACTLPCAGLTAWNALFGSRPIRPGEWILVQGTGGASLAALQWGKAAGSNVIVTSSSDRKLARAAALGADMTINYHREQDWAGAVLAARGGAGVDIVVDVVALESSRTAASYLPLAGVKGQPAGEGSSARIGLGCEAPTPLSRSMASQSAMSRSSTSRKAATAP